MLNESISKQYMEDLNKKYDGVSQENYIKSVS